jgi:hypothetical protein
MGHSQKVMEQLLASVESNMALVTDAEGWSWEEALAPSV